VNEDLAEGGLPKKRVQIIIASLLVGLFMSALDSTVVATALPTIVGDLGSASHIGWVVTAYMLTATATTPLWGKLGDITSRKTLYQWSIVIFLVASILAGLSQTMLQLIVFRGLQGIGGGGVMVGSQAILAEIVSPRDRGRYSGIFGAVFGSATVFGPLIGGFLTEYLSWRWVFWINLPIGIVALVVTLATLPSFRPLVSKSIDYLGAITLMLAATCLVLFTSLGGNTLAWSSTAIILLALGAVLLTAAHLFTERRADNPLIPLSLYRNKVFATASIMAFIVGLAMFGVFTFLPQFYQLVKGVSPTMSGIATLPAMGGLFAASIITGQIVSRRGRYKIFPILGTFLITVGMILLSFTSMTTSWLEASFAMLVFGVGLGLTAQVLVLAVQNAVSYENLGTATSSSNFFRSIGGVFGVALFGAIYATLLPSKVGELLHIPVGPLRLSHLTPAAISQMPPQVRASVKLAITDSLQTIFLVGAPLAAIAFFLSWLLPEVELRKVVRAGGDNMDVIPSPEQRSSLAEVEFALERLVAREDRRDSYRALGARAGIELSGQASWLLFRFEELSVTNRSQLTAHYKVAPEVFEESLDELARAGYLVIGAAGEIDVTPEGDRAMSQLVEARRAAFEELLEGWDPASHPELEALVRRLASKVMADDDHFLRAVSPGGGSA